MAERERRDVSNLRARFKTESLHLVRGGMLAGILDSAIDRAMADVIDRPGDDRARKVTLELLFSPQGDMKSGVDSVEFRYRVKSTVPVQEDQPVFMAADPKGSLTFPVHHDDIRRPMLPGIETVEE